MKRSGKEISEYAKKMEKFKNLTIIGIEDSNKHINRLKMSKVVFSAALQEGFGFAVMKSIQCGNIPVLPNRCCYPEFFPKKYLYNHINEARDMIRSYVSTYPEHYFKLDLSKFSYLSVINYLKD